MSDHDDSFFSADELKNFVMGSDPIEYREVTIAQPYEWVNRWGSDPINFRQAMPTEPFASWSTSSLKRTPVCAATFRKRISMCGRI